MVQLINNGAIGAIKHYLRRVKINNYARETALNQCKTCEIVFSTLADEKHDECMKCILDDLDGDDE